MQPFLLLVPLRNVLPLRCLCCGGALGVPLSLTVLLPVSFSRDFSDWVSCLILIFPLYSDVYVTAEFVMEDQSHESKNAPFLAEML